MNFYLRLLLALPLVAAVPVLAQLPPGYIDTLTSNVAVLGPTSPPATVTATVKPYGDAPVSSLDGMLVEFGSVRVPVENGTASVQIPYSLSAGGGSQAFATFPYTTPPTPGASTKSIEIGQRVQPLVTALSGNYVFSLHSYTGNGTSQGGEGVSIGVLQFPEPNDASATITGELDYNGALGSFQALPVTGSYAIDGNGFGSITLHTSAGTQHFDLFAQAPQLIFQNRISQVSLVETDTPRLAGSGMLVTSSSPKTDVHGTVLQLTGLADYRSPFPIPLSLNGSVGGIVSPAATIDLVAGAYVVHAVPATVTTIGDGADALGRFAFTLTVPNQSAQQPSHYAGYGIDDAHVLLLSTDPVDSTSLLSGTATVPQ